MKIYLRPLLIAALLGSMGASAYAQANLNIMPSAPPKTAEEREAEERTQKRYRDSLHTIPNAGPVDPWGDVRGSGSAAKGAKSGKAQQR